MPYQTRIPISEPASCAEPLWERVCSEIEHRTSCELPVRRFASSDSQLLPPLTYPAFADTVDSAPLELWTNKTSSIVNGRYGKFLTKASFVAEDACGQLIGAVLATDFPIYQAPVIALIAVLPSAQRRGVGACLLRRCMNALAVEGFPLCRARISPGNEASRRLFLKTGFHLATLRSTTRDS